MKAGFCQECWAAWKGGGCSPWEGGAQLSTAEGSPSHGHLEHILRAVRSGWCCTLRPVPSQALSQPQIIMDFSSWSQRQGQTFCLEAGLRLEPESIWTSSPGNWAVRGSSHLPAAGSCFALLCVLWKEQVWFHHIPFSSLQPFSVCSQKPSLPAGSCTGSFRDVYKVFFSLLLSCGCWGLLLR